MIRQVKVARDAAVKARTSAMITLEQLVVNAHAEPREQLADLGDKALITRCAGFRVGEVTTTTGSAKYVLRALGRRWQALHAEIVDADRLLDRLTRSGSVEGAPAVWVKTDVDDLAALDREDLIELLGWHRTRPLRSAGHAQLDHHGVTIDLHTVDRGDGSFGMEAPVPIEDLFFVPAAGPRDLLV